MRVSRRQAIGIGACAALGAVAPAIKAEAASAYEIDTNVGATLDRFHRHASWSPDFARRAVGILVFPNPR